MRENFIACLDKLFRQGCYVGIATHDDYLVHAGMALVDKYGLKPEQYEFQMLLGVKPDLRKMIIAQGHRLRVYCGARRELDQREITSIYSQRPVFRIGKAVGGLAPVHPDEGP